MIEVRDLLSKFENILLSEEHKRNAVRQAVAETLGTPIDIGAVRMRGNVVYLDLKPIYKNEIFLKREQIQKRLDELMLGKNNRTLEIR